MKNNVYLNYHEDRDFTFSAVTIRMKETYTPDQKIVAYFTFPRLEIAVPLRPGDVLFFNPQESYCVSSCCDNTDEIYVGGTLSSRPIPSLHGWCGSFLN